MHELSRTGHGRWLLLGAATFAFAALRAAPVSAQTLIVDGSGTLGAATFDIGSATQRRYDHVCVINGGLVTVDPYMGGDKAVQGNLELIAGSVYVDATSKISARGAGYQGRTCDAGDGPTLTSGGRGGCSVADSGGGGAHFGNGGRGTVDAPVAFPVSFEDACTSTWTGSTCSSFADCGTPMMSCPDGRGGRFCEIGPSVAGLGFWHNIFEPEFGAAGGDKGCRDNNAFSPMTAGAGGGRVVLVGLHDLTSVKTSPCGIGLSRGQVEVDGQIDANGKRGCGIGNDSAGGGAGGTVLIVGEQVTIGASAVISAKGGRGGDTFAAASGQPDYRDCIAGAQTGGTCDDCGGGGGGGVINVQSVTSNIDPAANFDVGGALGGVCTVCTGEAGGGAGELQIDSAYVGEICDGYDNDFDGTIDEGLGSVDCGLGTCTTPIPACQNGAPVSCTPTTGSDRTCKADPAGAKPRVAVILDTSASMLLTLSGYPTFGDGSVEHPGLDLNGDTLSNDSRLFLARESLGQVMSAYPEIEFSLARYHQDQAKDRNCQTAAWYECKGLVASYDNPVGNTGPKVCDVAIGPSTKIAVNQLPQSPEECINYAGSCGGPRRGADVLAGFGMPVRDIVRWLDGRETNFVNTTTVGDYCDHSKGGDCEVRGSGPTPLAGSLEAIQDYLGPIRATDPATSCRGYSVILVTDGAESCNGDPAAAAQSLHDAFGVEVYVIAVSVLPTEQASLNAIASAGSGGARPTATFVSQPQDLVPALSTIIAGSIHSEKCNGMDDDCDGKIDEDFP
ncbi:MAG TPA: vWA domain-containing protein, partial [Caldimonas sp.]